MVISPKFHIGRGNNDAAVRSVIKHRAWWQSSSEEDFAEASFIWTQWKKQRHTEYLSTHPALKQTFPSGYHSKTASIGSMPSSQRSPKTPRKNLNDVLSEISGGSQTILKVYNRMEQNKQITNKKGLFLNMKEYYELQGIDPFDVLPNTFLVRTGVKDEEYKKFTDYYHKLAQKIKDTDHQRRSALETRQNELRNQKNRNVNKSTIKVDKKGGNSISHKHKQ